MATVTQDDLARYAEIKEKLDRLTREVAKAEGSQEQTMARLKTEFGVTTIEDAEALLDKLADELEESETAVAGYLAELEALTDWSKL